MWRSWNPNVVGFRQIFANLKSDGFSDSFTPASDSVLFWKAFFHHSSQSATSHAKTTRNWIAIYLYPYRLNSKLQILIRFHSRSRSRLQTIWTSDNCPQLHISYQSISSDTFAQSSKMMVGSPGTCRSPILEFPSWKAITRVQTSPKVDISQKSNSHIWVLRDATVTWLGKLVVLHVLCMLIWPWPNSRSRSRSRGFWTSDN